jgi:CHAT domain-containing protein
LARYELTDEVADLEESISHSVEVILSPSDPQIGHDSDVVTAFFFLADTLFRRSHRLKRPDDSKHGVRYIRYLRDQSLETSRITRGHIKTAFTQAITIHLRIGKIDPTRNVEEMAVLCRELLRLDASEGLVLSAVETLSDAIYDEPFSVGRPPPDQAIECLRGAHIRFPDSESVSLTLLSSLSQRFMATHSHADYEEAILIVDRSPLIHPVFVNLTSHSAVELALSRFYFYGNPEHLEEAMSRIRNYLKTAPSEDPDREDMTRFLENLRKARLRVFSVGSNPRAADAGSTEVNNNPSPSHPVSPLSITRSDIGEINPMTQEEGDLHGLDTLFHLFNQATDKAGCEEALKFCRRLLETYELSQESDSITLMVKSHLAIILVRAFRCTDDVAYLNESISLLRDVLERPVIPSNRLTIVRLLNSALISRFSRFREMVGSEEIMRLFPIGAADTSAKIPDRFNISCQWARFARYLRHPSTATAYKEAISLLKDSLVFGPTLEIQHYRLVSRRVDYETLPWDYASYQIDIGELKQAIETLERGRGLLWSEMRGLRMSVDQLRLVNSPLAERLATINKELEALTTSSSAGIWPNEGQVDSDDLVDPFGRLLIKQRTLVTERDNLISQIQSLPGFETFLMTPSFDALHSAAEHGPVITINHSRWRSDMIILLRDSPPSLIPTADNFYERAKQLKDQLLDARNDGLESGAYNDALSHVLESLYDLVGRPVIQRLHELNVPEQSRIWFCPTSVLCSLPLHAMGPIRSEGSVKFYFSDLYIPSYTPTLGALIESRKLRAQPLDRPSMLLVIQPDAKMPKALQEMQAIQSVGLSTTTLIWETATPSAVLEHLRDYPFVHVSCHGNLETGRPFDAFFKLYEGARLTLLDIARSRLPTGEFAFLSACHTAELTDESMADEGLHLAGAVQYCGFRSVVGTMWEMADDDGPELGWNFYRSVFSNRWQGMAYYERTAEALRDAVKELRKRRNMTLERWVNFVHYGA